MTPINEAEFIIARYLRAMFEFPGSEEELYARMAYIKYKIEDGKKCKTKKRAVTSAATPVKEAPSS